MLSVALCLFLIAETFGHTHHHHGNIIQLSLGNRTLLSSKDSFGYLDNITDTDWVIPDIKYLHDVKEIEKGQPDQIEQRKVDDRKTINRTTTATSVNMTTNASKPIIEYVIKNGETPLKVQGIINAPIIVVETSHHRRRHQHFKQPNSTEASTSKLKEKLNVLPPVRPQHSNPGRDKWNYDSTLPEWPVLSEYAVLNEGFIIADRDNDFKSTIVHPTMIHEKNYSPRGHTHNINTPQYIKIPPPVPTLSPWYDGYGK